MFAWRGPGATGALRGRGKEEHPSLTTVICTLNMLRFCVVRREFAVWCQAPGTEEGENQASGRVSGAPGWNAPAQQGIVLARPGGCCCARSLVAVTAAWTMAAAESPSAALRRRDLCSRGIRLAGKMRADVVDLLDAYVEQQGLDASASVAAVEGVPLAAVERWDEQTGTQRLLENLAAYRAFRALLAQMLEEQREQLGEADAGLGRALAAVLLQVSAFAYHLEELLRLESRGIPGEEGDEEEEDGPPPPPRLSLFEQKLRGLGVLRELAQWAVRSVRDLRQLAKPSLATGAAPSLAESP
ncbi:ciliary neurotrophic factor [Camarhynchus parvulus]|nr:ciliary neurotrophic factor [Camarhynchus parvulus]